MPLPTPRPRPLPVALLLALLLAAAPREAAAEDEEADPATAYAERTAAFPAPAGKAGFTFLGVLRMDGKNLGHALLEARPAADADTPTWSARERFVMKGRATPAVEEAWARLAPDLRLLRGGARRAGGPGLTWERTAEGFTIQRRAGDGEAEAEPETSTHPHDATALNTMAATVLFMQGALDHPGRYATSIFEPEDVAAGKAPLQEVVIEILGEQEVQGHRVLAATATKADKTLTALFDPATRAPVAVRLEQGERKVEILPGDVWTMPARNAVDAGMRAMLGFATKELRILDDVTDWPTLHATTRAGLPEAKREAFPALEAWRTQMLAQWSKRLQERPVPMLQQIIQSQRAQIREEPVGEDGWVRLTFPPMLQGMQIVVGPKDGVWHVVQLPPPPRKGDAAGGK